MPITYPISFPSALGIAQISIRARSVVAVTESDFTFQQQVQVGQGQRWEADVTLPQMNRAYAEQFNAFLLKLNGRRGTFLLGDPNAASPQGVGGGSPVVDGASQTGNELNITGLTPSTTGVYLAGDYIQLGTGASAYLHKILSDVDSDSNGDATLLIWPSLRASPSNGASIIVNNTVGRFRLAESVSQFDINSESTYTIQFSAVEAL